MGKALYRKYRSKSLNEVVGQQHVTETLKKAIKNGRIRHAYLFSGPKGVGKTSVARILAHEINQLPYTDDSIHLDIIEIDAASNRRIDEVRDLRDKVHIAPTSAKYKVYIIDEVHMLTREAFNALLKTLEEPPEHVVFLLATTEAHKLPETIVSRTQHFTFKPVSKGDLAGHLESVAKSEKVKLEPQAVEILAEYGQGSVRDSLSLLDQLAADKSSITAEDVRDLVGMPPAEAIESLLNAVRARQPKAVIELLEELDGRGANAAMVAKMLSQAIRIKIVEGEHWDLGLLRGLVEVPGSSDPRQHLEIALLEAASHSQAGASLPVYEETPEPMPEYQPVPDTKAEEPVAAEQPKKPLKQLDKQTWSAVIAEAKAKAPGIYSALRLAKPTLAGSDLTLAFEFPLHQKKIAAAKNLAEVAKLIEKVTGQKFTIATTIDKNTAVEPVSEQAEVSSISNIFGGAEVLES